MGKLYIVGTPIGNLEDLSPRAVRILGEVDFIAAEDTRVSVKLLNRFDIKKPMVSYFEHNKAARGEEIIARLKNGENCAIVTDAGMPAISDPGEDLVRMCHENGVETESVPGPSAVITALALSGMASGRFCFEGFLSMNKRSRITHLKELMSERRTMIFYEAPHKLLSTLKDMFEHFGEREICLARELTKLHEEAVRTTFSAAIEKYTNTAPKGEFVLITAGAKEQETTVHSLEDAIKYAKELHENGMSATAAAKSAAGEFGYKKSDIYIHLAKGGAHDEG